MRRLSWSRNSWSARVLRRGSCVPARGVRLNADDLRADGCLWEGGPARLSDGRAAVGLGFKGMLAVRLDIELLKSDAHSAAAVVAPSAAWRLVEALTSLRDRDGTVRVDG